jgi:hypothetical protein
MKNKKFEITETIENKIISAAYRDAKLIDRITVWYRTKKHEEAKALFAAYRATADEIVKAKEVECPDKLLGLDKNVNGKPFGFLADVYAIIFSRPVLSFSVFAVIVFAVVIGTVRNKTVEYEFTKAEIMEADKQAQQAFMIVSDIFKQTKSSIEIDVLGNKVAKPLNAGFEIINNLFEGEKNEIN